MSVDASTTPDAARADAAADARVPHDAGTPDSRVRDALAEGAVDAGSLDAPLRDAPLPDAGMHSCPTHYPPGACSDFARVECQLWGQEVGAGYTDPSAPLVCDGATGWCARASYCSSPDESTCRCGDGPECGTGEVCARRYPTSPYECLPCRADL